MKKMSIFLTLLAAFALGEAQAQYASGAGPASGSVITHNGPVARFDKMTADLGDIELRVPRTAEFTLTNDGNEPLIIQTATTSCGCTNLKYEKDPILPGKSSTISVTYNAAAQGTFVKSITVKTNAAEQSVALQIKGKVVEKKG